MGIKLNLSSDKQKKIPDEFKELAKNFAENILIVFAKEKGTTVAAAMHVIGNNTLYGRYWGSNKNIKYLHFELCYYQAIEWAINNKYDFVEGGAQGPHKIQRGYMPEKTFSSHYIANKNFVLKSTAIFTLLTWLGGCAAIIYLSNNFSFSESFIKTIFIGLAALTLPHMVLIDYFYRKKFN